VVKYSVKGNVLQLEVPKKALGFDDDTFDFSFKWSDNMQNDGDIMDFYTNGDVAPGGRFCFRFQNAINNEKTNIWLLVIIITSIILIVCVICAILILKKRKSKHIKE